MTPEQIAERSRVPLEEVRSILVQLEQAGSVCRCNGLWAHHTYTPEAVQAWVRARLAKRRVSGESDGSPRTPTVPCGPSDGPARVGDLAEGQALTRQGEHGLDDDVAVPAADSDFGRRPQLGHEVHALKNTPDELLFAEIKRRGLDIPDELLFAEIKRRGLKLATRTTRERGKAKGQAASGQGRRCGGNSAQAPP